MSSSVRRRRSSHARAHIPIGTGWRTLDGSGRTLEPDSHTPDGADVDRSMPCSTDSRRDRGLIAAGTAREARDGRLVAVAAAPEHGSGRGEAVLARPSASLIGAIRGPGRCVPAAPPRSTPHRHANTTTPTGQGAGCKLTSRRGVSGGAERGRRLGQGAAAKRTDVARQMRRLDVPWARSAPSRAVGAGCCSSGSGR